MANFHLTSKQFIDNLIFSQDDIIVEIGSERGEGSTAWFDKLANSLGVDFYSVDVSTYASTTLTDLQNTKFVVTDSGSTWAHNELPKLNKKIKVLYLDNYDWISTLNSLRPVEEDLISEYKSRGTTMSNLDCQREHLYQMIGCLPYMAEESIIICDDTPYQSHSGVYTGKNGAVVPYLLNYGYDIVFGKQVGSPSEYDNGLILKR